MKINPASKKCPPTPGLKCLLRRRMLCRFKEKRSIIDGHLRRGDTGQKIRGKYMKILQTSSNIYKLPAIADDCFSILLAVLLAPQSCTTRLLFIDYHRSTPNFLCFSRTSKHYGVQLGSWATVYYMNMYMAYACTCTDQGVETSVQSHPILYQYVPITRHACNTPTNRY